jgi:hypothetical protein
MECRRNMSNFARFTPSVASEISCESSGVGARIAPLQKAFSQVGHLNSRNVPRRKENVEIFRSRRVKEEHRGTG